MAINRIYLFLKSTVIHYIYLSKAVSFIFALVAAHGLVKNAVTDVLMLYLTEDWKQSNLMKAAAIVNIEDALSSAVALFVAIATERSVGRFKMVICTTVSFIWGLVLLWLSTYLPMKKKHATFYVALLLIAFGKAGKEPPLRSFLRDQVSGENPQQVEDRTTFWWRVCRFIGAVISVFVLANATWKETFSTCSIVMGAACLVYLAGMYCPYHFAIPPGNPFSVLLRVLKSAFAKRGLNYPLNPSGYFRNLRNELHLFPPHPFLRCIDKAAIVDVEAGCEEKKLCTVAEVTHGKSFLGLFPLWFAFIIYGVVAAAGGTFFVEQSNYLNDKIGHNFKLPINTFFIFKSFSSFMASFLANMLLERFCSRNEIWKLQGGLIRVGVGIGLSIACCMAAFLVEHRRVHLLEHVQGNPDDEPVLRMSIFVLTPQFVLLGVTEGLIEDGLVELFKFFMVGSMQEMETPIIQFVSGIGKALSVGFVFVFPEWFGDTSRLDKYFDMLMYLSLSNFVLFVPIGFYYVYIQKQEAQNNEQHEAKGQVEQRPEIKPPPGQPPQQEDAQEQDKNGDDGDEKELDSLHEDVTEIKAEHEQEQGKRQLRPSSVKGASNLSFGNILV